MEAEKVLMIEETHNTQPENKIAGEVLYSSFIISLGRLRLREA
jgi:hypothetical protein